MSMFTKYLTNRFFNWMTYEPAIGLMMIIATVVIFLWKYRREGEIQEETFWKWCQRLIEALGVAILFLGLLWAFRAILNNNYNEFRGRHGRVSEANYASVKRIWGSPHVQRELQIYHFIKKTFKEEIPREDPSKPPLYKKVIRDIEVEQNSILASRGEIELSLNKRKKGSAYYNGFISKFHMEYEIINNSEYTTDANFNFPLETGQMLYENFRILRNDKDISTDLRFTSAGVSWIKKMIPGEKQKIVVSYTSRGLEHFYYQLPRPREIKDFYLKMKIDKLPVSDVNYPEGCLTPKSIKATSEGSGSILEWTLDKAITTAGMGVALPKPEQPGAKVALVLKNSPYALMLLIVAISLIFLIHGERINFLEISLLSAVYSLLFIVMASITDFAVGFWGALPIGALLSMGLSFLLYRRHSSKFIRYSIYSLVGFFSLIYPLSGLLPDYQEPFNGIVIIGLIIYFFWISLFRRLREKF